MCSTTSWRCCLPLKAVLQKFSFTRERNFAFKTHSDINYLLDLNEMCRLSDTTYFIFTSPATHTNMGACANTLHLIISKVPCFCSSEAWDHLPPNHSLNVLSLFPLNCGTWAKSHQERVAWHPEKERATPPSFWTVFRFMQPELRWPLWQPHQADDHINCGPAEITAPPKAGSVPRPTPQGWRLQCGISLPSSMEQ